MKDEMTRFSHAIKNNKNICPLKSTVSRKSSNNQSINIFDNLFIIYHAKIHFPRVSALVYFISL